MNAVSLCELMPVSALLCLDDSVFLELSNTSVSYSFFFATFSTEIPEP